jgi:hypothetical protein
MRVESEVRLMTPQHAELRDRVQLIHRRAYLGGTLLADDGPFLPPPSFCFILSVCDRFINETFEHQ